MTAEYISVELINGRMNKILSVHNQEYFIKSVIKEYYTCSIKEEKLHESLIAF